MSFTIEQTSSLKLMDKNNEVFEVPAGELKETGKDKLIGNQQFKEDREERMVEFVANIEQGEVKVEVTYSMGMDGHEVQDVNVVQTPDGLEVQSDPEFETKNCEDN